MPYKRFLREAEPCKISPCGSCGGQLKRSPKVFPYLVGMLLVLAAIVLPTLYAAMSVTLSPWVLTALAVLLLAAWVIVINYIAWRIIPWVPVEVKKGV